MTSDFEQPTQQDTPTKEWAPAPWKKQIDYKSGKVPEGLVAKTDPQDVKAGFSHYDKDAKARFSVDGFTASIVAITFGVSGTVPDGNYYINHYSNFVFDTRTQPIEVFYFARSGEKWEKVVIAEGIYNDFKSTLPKGVEYAKFLICWIHETSELVSIGLTSQLEVALKEAIASATASPVQKIDIFKIASAADRFWAIKFSGEFTKRTREGQAWQGKGDMFFNPSLVAKVATAERFPVLAEMKQAVKDYIEASEAQVWASSDKKKPVSAPLPHPDTVLPSRQPQECYSQTDPVYGVTAPTRSITANHESGFGPVVEVAFPSDAPPVDYAKGPEPTDDLPF